MIRRILDFVFILLFMWICMIAGLWLISEVIVPFEMPGINNDVVTSILKVAASVGLVLFWLWLWREIVKRTFWRNLRTQIRTKEREDEKAERNPKGGEARRIGDED